MSLRSALTDTLSEGLGDGYRVIGYPPTLDGISLPTVALWASGLRPPEEAPIGRYEVEFTVLLLTAYQDPARADDDLDDTLTAVLGVLWDSGPYLLREGKRTVSEDNRIHSWTLTVTAGIEINESEGS